MRNIFFAHAHMPIWAYLAKYAHMGIWAYAKKIWPSGVSQKRAKKCLVFYIITLKNRIVRDLAQKAKWSEIFRRSRIQHLEVWGRDLVHFVSP